jgi:hypothetical protein
MGTGKVIGANRAYRGAVSGLGNVRESNYAEIVWFVRGTTLYRQARLIIGDDQNLRNLYPAIVPVSNNFHDTNDVSVYEQGGNFHFNTLSTLARRENRFAHRYVGLPDFPFPHDSKYRELRLPTMAELNGGFTVPAGQTYPTTIDLWNEPNYAANAVNGSDISAKSTGWLANGNRAGEDIVLTNVISFDIKVWNPAANEFVDLGNSSAGAFGSQGRYSGGTGLLEGLVTRVNFDENKDRSPSHIPDAAGVLVENPNYHDIGSNELYREDRKGNTLPLSDLTSDAQTPSFPPLNPSAPATTLTIGAWSGFLMHRVFDTWTRQYETISRHGGELYDPLAPILPTDTPHNPAHIVDYNQDEYWKINVDTHGYSLTQYFLVTFGQEQTGTSTFMYDRWHYSHHSNAIPDPNNPPPATIPDKPDRFFERFNHSGVGTFEEAKAKQSGAYWECPPPYDAEFKGLEITIRCFDPKSGNIRQVRVVKHAQ